MNFDKEYENKYRNKRQEYREKSTPYFDVAEIETNGEKTRNSMEEKYEYVNHPTHYNKYDIEVIDMMRKIWGDEATALWCRMTAFKYRMRLGEKPDNPIEQDLKKEQWYLNKSEEIKKKENKISEVL